MTVARRTAAAGVALLGAAIAVYVSGDSDPGRASEAGVAADPEVVAVFPFSVQVEQAALSDLRDAIHDLIASRFPGNDGGPRALDPATVARVLRSAGRADNDDVPLETSLHVAAGLGAGQVLLGAVSGTPDALSVDAMLVTVPDGALQARAQLVGSADSLPHLADRLSARLLAVHAARDSTELAAFTGTSPRVIRAYLAGCHASRRGKMGTNSEATRHFERALFFDSTFALAALRLTESAAVFGMSELDARWKLDALWRQRDRLGVADRALLDAYIGPRYPRPATLAELIAAGERAARAAPGRAEAWRQAGISWLRFGLMLGHPEWEARAEDALRRAFALDSTDALTIEFLWHVAAQSGDLAAVRRYTRLQLAQDRGGERTEFIRWMSALVQGDSAGLAHVRTRFAAIPSLSVLYILTFSQILGAGLDDGDRVARILEEGATTAPPHRQVLEFIVPFMLNRGRSLEASRLLGTGDRFGQGRRKDVGVLEFRVFAALYWDGDSSDAAAAVRSLEAYLDGAPVPQGQVRDRETAACALAHWRLATGDLARADAALARLLRLSATAGYAIESTPVCAAAADARLAAIRHRPDAAALLERLDTLLRAGSDVRQLVPTVATVIAARLFEQRGDPRRAHAIARRRSPWVNQLLSTQLREEGRLSALVGDTAGAVRAYRHYLALRSDPEPRLRPEVEGVRSELQRLERLSPAP